MKLIIAGGRNFTDYDLLKTKIDRILSNTESVEVVSGGARGADALGERYAKERSHSCTIFPADWDKYGRGAGYIRNKQMAQYATHLIAFWDGKSKGTKHMITLANEYALKVRVVRV